MNNCTDTESFNASVLTKNSYSNSNDEALAIDSLENEVLTSQKKVLEIQGMLNKQVYLKIIK